MGLVEGGAGEDGDYEEVLICGCECRFGNTFLLLICALFICFLWV